MLGNFTEVISKLEQQKAAIDKAIGVLREFDGDAPAEQAKPKKNASKKGTKRIMSEEARQRIAAAQKKRWAGARKAAKKSAKKSA